MLLTFGFSFGFVTFGFGLVTFGFGLVTFGFGHIREFLEKKVLA